MRNDELTYPDVIAEATREATMHGLLAGAAERDECLFVTLTDTQPPRGVPPRLEVTFWTSGTGAFLVDLDQRWSWQVFADEREGQVEAIRDIIRVAHRYLSGIGAETLGPGRRGRPRIVLDVDGENVVLQERNRPGR